MGEHDEHDEEEVVRTHTVPAREIAGAIQKDEIPELEPQWYNLVPKKPKEEQRPKLPPLGKIG